MGFFDKPEVIILKESSDAKRYLEQLETLYERAAGPAKEQIEREIKYTKAGIIGEEQILFELKNSGMDMYVLQDIYIESGELSAQIDFYVVTPKVNFVIECKNLFGNIEINNRGDFIRTFEINGKKIKEGIYSPVTQNERHLTVIKNKKLENANILQRVAINAYFDGDYKSLVVLANPKTVLNSKFAKKEIKEKVIRADQLITVIKKVCRESKTESSSKKIMRELAEGMLAQNVEERKEYIRRFQKMVEVVEKTISEEDEKKDDICPKCGNKLIERKGKYGVFIGCSGYPKCRFTKNIDK